MLSLRWSCDSRVHNFYYLWKQWPGLVVDLCISRKAVSVWRTEEAGASELPATHSHRSFDPSTPLAKAMLCHKYSLPTLFFLSFAILSSYQVWLGWFITRQSVQKCTFEVSSHLVLSLRFLTKIQKGKHKRIRPLPFSCWLFPKSMSFNYRTFANIAAQHL